MGTSTSEEYFRDRETPGTYEHFFHHVPKLWDEAEDKRGLPSPDELRNFIGDDAQQRGMVCDVLTPDLAEWLGGIAKQGTLRRGLLVVSLALPVKEFNRARERALEEAEREGFTVRPAPHKHGQRGAADMHGFLFLYLLLLTDQTSADLAREYLHKGTPSSFSRDRADYKRKVTQVGKQAKGAAVFLREWGAPVSDF